MKIQPDSLDISLKKRSWSQLLFIFACIGLAAFQMNASRLSEWLTAIIVLGPTYYVFFGGPSFVYRWQSNPMIAVKVGAFALRVTLLLMVLWYVTPFTVSIFEKALGS